MLKKKIKKISIIFVLTVVLLSCLVIPCSAWSPVSDYSAVNGSQGALTQRAMGVAFGEVIWTCCYSNTGVFFTNVDVSLVYDFIEKNPSLLNLTRDDILRQLKINITVYQPLSYDTSSVDSALLDSISVCVDSYFNGEQVGYDNGFSAGSSASYNQGYNDGLNESDIAENTILTIFSAPTYILATIFDFELFGINLYSLICFFLTLTIVAFILKRVL